MLKLQYDWQYALSGGAVTITRLADKHTVHLQGDDASAFSQEEDDISDKANGYGEPYYVRSINNLCAAYFN